MNRSGESEKMKFVIKRDIVVIMAILLVAAAGILALSLGGSEKADDIPDGVSQAENRLFATIYYRGVGVHAAYLDEDTIFNLPYNTEVQFEIKEGAIAFIHSDCPDQLCIDVGWQDVPGGFAACLPNQVLFFIDMERATDAETGAEADIITQ